MSTVTAHEKFDLRKKMVFDLVKGTALENQKAQVVLCMDFSGSMGTLYRNGYVQDVLERIVPVSMQFDDDQKFQLYLFHDRAIKLPLEVGVDNVAGIVNRDILPKYNMGGTEYAPPIHMIKADYCTGTAKKGVFGFGAKTGDKMKTPVYVIFITDGENGDKSEAEEALKDISHHGVFFQFIGIGDASFNFLRKLDDLSGRFLDNANFLHIESLGSLSDEQLYSKLLVEFPGWVPQARAKGLIE